ncbi:hypothetical protein LXL04_031078 [Taraxacum kok-saghyz]
MQNTISWFSFLKEYGINDWLKMSTAYRLQNPNMVYKTPYWFVKTQSSYDNPNVFTQEKDGYLVLYVSFGDDQEGLATFKQFQMNDLGTLKYLNIGGG